MPDLALPVQWNNLGPPLGEYIRKKACTSETVVCIRDVQTNLAYPYLQHISRPRALYSNWSGQQMAAWSPALSGHFSVEFAKLGLDLFRRQACALQIIRIPGDRLNFNHVSGLYR